MTRRPRVLWVHTCGAKANEFFSSKFDLVTPKSWEKEHFKKLVADIDLLVVRRVPPGFQITGDILNAAKKLKLIQKMGECLDCIDVDAARKVGVPVSTLKTLTDISVAEHTILLILALSKNLVNAHKGVVNAEYLSLNLEPKDTTETCYVGNWVDLPISFVHGKTLGLIGMGEIGRAVAKRANSFGMKVLYYRRHRLSQQEEKRLKITYRTFEELLMESDYVSLHVPHTKETEKMIGEKQISLMKRTAFLINTSRGKVIDEEALYWALKNNIIAGAGLDVFEKEPTPKDNPLLKLNNVILTPHIAGLPRTEIFERDVEKLYSNFLKIIKKRT